MQAMIRETGAVLMGKRAFEMGDPDSYVGTYEFQVPIFVLTHEPPTVPPKQDEHLTFTFVTDRPGVRRRPSDPRCRCCSARDVVSSITSTWVTSTSRSSPCRRWGRGRASPSES